MFLLRLENFLFAVFIHFRKKVSYAVPVLAACFQKIRPDTPLRAQSYPQFYLSLDTRKGLNQTYFAFGKIVI